MIEATVQEIEPNRVTRYTLQRNGKVLTFAEVLEGWQGDAEFRSYFTQLLVDSPFGAFRWETPALTQGTAQRPFEFVLLSSPSFQSRVTDADTFKSFFSSSDVNAGIVAFASLKGDATMIVPSPRASNDVYGHLASFLRKAPKQQTDALWQVVSSQVRAKLGNNPLWLSTAGGGVAWLHVRIDSRPKYYGYEPYRMV